MVTARERLRQLTLDQESAQNEADRVVVQPRFNEPRGGGILARPIRPSTAESLEPEESTPFTDFGEFFLNQLGITSPRQRIARIESAAAIHQANLAITQAVEDQRRQIEARGLGGFDVEIFNANRLQQEKAAELLDNPDPSIQEYGRVMMQAVSATYDQMNKDHFDRLNTVRDQVAERLNGLVDLGRAEASANDGVVALLNEYGERNGINAKLPAIIKQSISEYMSGTNFTQKGGETRGMLDNLPGFNVAYDPTEEITVGNASSLIAAIKQERERTVAGSLASELQNATRSGFRIADKDGKLTAEELPVAELEPDISKLNFLLPRGEAFSIQSGVPSKEDARRTAQANMDIAGATSGKLASGMSSAVSRGVGDMIGEIDKGLKKLLGVGQPQKRPTND